MPMAANFDHPTKSATSDQQSSADEAEPMEAHESRTRTSEAQDVARERRQKIENERRYGKLYLSAICERTQSSSSCWAAKPKDWVVYRASVLSDSNPVEKPGQVYQDDAKKFDCYHVLQHFELLYGSKRRIRVVHEITKGNFGQLLRSVLDKELAKIIRFHIKHA